MTQRRERRISARQVSDSQLGIINKTRTHVTFTLTLEGGTLTNVELARLVEGLEAVLDQLETENGS